MSGSPEWSDVTTIGSRGRAQAVPSPLALVDVRNGLACCLRLCRGAFGLVEHAAARKRISSKRVFRPLKEEMATTVSWFERGESPTARDVRWARCAWRTAA
jgi:hypothetical protein